jgi:RNA polymerase sigma-70 factor, ECF subfamily
MDERDWLAERFQQHRPRLLAVAYRMLGSTNEADDAVQETWLRLSRSNAGEIDNLEAWLVTVVGRVALSMLRSRKTRREEPLEVHLLEPITNRADGIDPEQEVLLADSVGLALFVVLETLTPAERLAYVLHDVFSVAFEEIGAILERSPAAARQLASRARRRIRGADARPRRTWQRSNTSFKPSSPRRGMATSMPWSPCSIRMSCAVLKWATERSSSFAGPSAWPAAPWPPHRRRA